MHTDSIGAVIDTQQFVCFELAGEEYGIPITQVQEIIRFERLTSVPQAPEFIRGVLNLRGRVIPVIDLRRKFAMQSREQDRNTRIVVVEVTGTTMGMVVDEVTEVCNIEASEVEPTPPLGVRVRTDFIRGMAKLGERLMILLDIEQVLSEDEHAAMELVAGQE